MAWPTSERLHSLHCVFRRSFATAAVLVVIVPILAGCSGLTKASDRQPHSAVLSWDPSTSAVVGYNVYRSSVSGGPYAILNSTPVTGTTYTDAAVQSSQTYFYVVTAVDASGVESIYSNQASAAIP